MFLIFRAAVFMFYIYATQIGGWRAHPGHPALHGNVQATGEELTAQVFIQTLLTRCSCPEPGLAWAVPAHRLLCLAWEPGRLGFRDPNFIFSHKSCCEFSRCAPCKIHVAEWQTWN